MNIELEIEEIKRRLTALENANRPWQPTPYKEAFGASPETTLPFPFIMEKS